MRFAQSANAKQTQKPIGQNGGNWPIPGSEFIFLCLWEQEQNSSYKTLRFSTTARYAKYVQK